MLVPQRLLGHGFLSITQGQEQPRPVQDTDGCQRGRDLSPGSQQGGNRREDGVSSGCSHSSHLY